MSVSKQAFWCRSHAEVPKLDDLALVDNLHKDAGWLDVRVYNSMEMHVCKPMERLCEILLENTDVLFIFIQKGTGSVFELIRTNSKLEHSTQFFTAQIFRHAVQVFPSPGRISLLLRKFRLFSMRVF